MGLYSRYIFPRILARAMESKAILPKRRRVVGQAEGRVLEIGFGSGANLPHYGPQVRELMVVEPDERVLAFAEETIARSPLKPQVHRGRAQALPFEDASMDTVVSTLTLCSVGGVQPVLAEIKRVLKPGGRLLFLEHGLSPDPRVARWQRRLDGVNARLAGGCHITIDIAVELETAALGPVQSESYYLKRAPKTHGFMTEGAAVKA